MLNLLLGGWGMKREGREGEYTAAKGQREVQRTKDLIFTKKKGIRPK
jgi:hypothetical protein